MASVTPFISKHIDVPQIHDMVLGSFKAFFRRNIMQYEGYSEHKVNFIGSIAVYFRPVLEEAAKECGCTIGRILKSPMEGLLTHSTPKTNIQYNIDNNGICKISEQSSLYNDLEKKSVGEILHDINNEDKKVALAVEKAIPAIEKLVSEIVPRMKRGGRIFYMGAGTSGRLGVLDASEIPPTFGMEPTWVIGLIAGGDTALRNPVENAEDDTLQGWKDLQKFEINDKDTVIGIAASGTTPYVIGAIEECRKHGILTAAITSNPDAPVSRAADIAIEMVVGPNTLPAARV